MSLDPARLAPMANAIRALSMDAVQKANIGHPGMPMGMADVATILWSEFLKFDPARCGLDPGQRLRDAIPRHDPGFMRKCLYGQSVARRSCE